MQKLEKVRKTMMGTRRRSRCWGESRKKEQNLAAKNLGGAHGRYGFSWKSRRKSTPWGNDDGGELLSMPPLYAKWAGLRGGEKCDGGEKSVGGERTSVRNVRNNRYIPDEFKYKRLRQARVARQREMSKSIYVRLGGEACRGKRPNSTAKRD